MTQLSVLLPLNELYREDFSKIWPRARFKEYSEWVPSPYALFARTIGLPDNFSIVNAHLSVEPELLKGNYQLATAVNTRVESSGAFLNGEPVRLTKGEKKAFTQGINEFMECESQKWVDIGGDTWLVRIRDGKPLSLPEIEVVVGKNLQEAMQADVDCASVMTEIQMWLQDSMVNYNRKQSDEPTADLIWFWGRGETVPSTEVAQNNLIISDLPYLSGIAGRIKWDHMTLSGFVDEKTSVSGYDKVVVDMGNYFENFIARDLHRDFLKVILEAFKNKHFERIEFKTLAGAAEVKPFKWWPFGK